MVRFDASFKNRTFQKGPWNLCWICVLCTFKGSGEELENEHLKKGDSFNLKTFSHCTQ